MGVKFIEKKRPLISSGNISVKRQGRGSVSLISPNGPAPLMIFKRAI